MPRRRRTGYTLLEVFVALVLLALMVALAGTSIPSSWAALSRSRQLRAATALGQRAMETARSTPFASMDTLAQGPQAVDFDGTTYTVQTTVTVDGTDLKRVETDVTWNHQAQSLRFSTRLYNFTNQ